MMTSIRGKWILVIAVNYRTIYQIVQSLLFYHFVYILVVLFSHMSKLGVGGVGVGGSGVGGMGARRNTEQQSVFTRQATILRKNLGEWDLILRNPKGEDWPRMLGRLNAAANQTTNLDKSIEDVMEHFVYLPKQSTANPQDIPFFLSTRLVDAAATGSSSAEASKKSDQQSIPPEEFIIQGDPVEVLSKYEMRAAQLAQEYEEDMDRF